MPTPYAGSPGDYMTSYRFNGRDQGAIDRQPGPTSPNMSVGDPNAAPQTDYYSGMPAPPQLDAPNLPSPEDYAGYQELIGQMLQMGKLDMETAQWMLKRAKQEYLEGKAQEREMQSLYGGVLGSSGGVNPNDPKTFALLGRQVQSIGQDRDRAEQQLRDSGIQGGELDAARAANTLQAYGAKAGARQDLVGKAIDYKDRMSQAKMFGVPVPSNSGAQNAMLGAYGQRQGTEAGYLSNIYGAQSGLAGSMYNSRLGAATSQRGQDIGSRDSRYGADLNYDLGMHNYNLGLEQLKAQKDANKRSFWGGILGTIGSTAAAFSDERLKRNVQAVGQVGPLTVYAWEWNGLADLPEGESATGFMASEVEELLPQAVGMREGWKTVDYQKVRSYLEGSR